MDGCRLRDLLQKAGVWAHAVEVVVNGADKGATEQTPDFVKAIPVRKALDENALIAFGMNGEPVPPWCALQLRRQRGVRLSGRRELRAIPVQLAAAGRDTLCTNRDLPLLMPVGSGETDLSLATGAPVSSIRFIAGPTEPRASTAHREVAWRLISHLSLNYLSLSDDQQRRGAASLRELLATSTARSATPSCAGISRA